MECMRARGGHSQETIDRAKEIFINSDFLSLADLSEQSERLVGQHISLDTLKYHSSNDPEGRWPILRVNRGRKTEDVPAAEKLAKVADKMYELLIDPENPVPNGSLAQLAKTWLDILVKTNMDKGTSATLSSQQAKDMIAKMMESDES